MLRPRHLDDRRIGVVAEESLLRDARLGRKIFQEHALFRKFGIAFALDLAAIAIGARTMIQRAAQIDQPIGTERDAMPRNEYQKPPRRYIAADIQRPTKGELRLCRSEEHTSELQSLMRTSYADFCLTKKT